jgi:glycosyltransferase involved in cell wall biosynthesis
MKPTKYKLSLIYFTYRPGAMDMLAGSLMQQTYDNYELIVVDDMPGRNLTTYFEDCNIPLRYYGPSKKKCYPDTPFNQVNAINTGVIKATGDITILIEDYAWLRPGSLERWCQAFDEKGPDTLISGVGEYWNYKPPEKIDPITAWNEPFTGDTSKCTHLGTWKPDEFEFFYSGVSMPAWEHLNGMDERLDYWNTWPALIWIPVCKDAGLKFYVDAGNVIDLVDHRRWTVKDDSLWWINNTYRGQQPKRPYEVKWNTVAPNCFNLKEMHRD